MKPITFSDAPGWEFEVDEVSANVYTVAGRDRQGRSIDKIGIDRDALIEQCHHEAKDILTNGKCNNQ